jgi:Ion channel
MPQSTHTEPEKVAQKPAGRVRSHAGLFRNSVAYCLAALVLIFVAAPFIEHFHGGEHIEAGLMTLVFLSAALAVGERRKTLAWAVVLVTPTVVGKWLNHLWPDLLPFWVFVGAGLLFVAFVVVHLLRFILRARWVNSEILCAGVATYLMLGWFWAFAYMLVNQLVPDSFVFTVGPAAARSMEGFRSLYFSYSTLTTVGYGDIIPVSSGGRMLAMTESIAGLFYVTLLIARLVALYYSKSATNGRPQ